MAVSCSLLARESGLWAQNIGRMLVFVPKAFGVVPKPELGSAASMDTTTEAKRSKVMLTEEARKRKGESDRPDKSKSSSDF